MKNYNNYLNKHLKTSEHVIQQQILAALPFYNVKPFRINSGMLVAGEGRNRRMVRMAQAGTPDILGCRYPDGKFIAIEVKRPGNKPTELQQMMINDLKSFGAIVFVATCVEDVEKKLKKHRNPAVVEQTASG